MTPLRDEIGAFRARQQDWERFARWESEQVVERSFTRDLAWLSEAMAIARSLGDAAPTEADVLSKAERLRQTRSRLSVLEGFHA